MTKQTKPQEAERKAGPKFGRSVIPTDFQIRRAPSPMADLLDEADRGQPTPHISTREGVTPEKSTGVKSTGVNFTPVKTPAVKAASITSVLPDLDTFLDSVLPRFPPARQAILLRLYRWSEGVAKEIVVSTPRLAAKTNMDEKSCRAHLHALIADGYISRTMEGGQVAKFGGHDRAARGLILQLSSAALLDLVD